MTKKIIIKLLSFSAKILLYRKKPEIVAITGSAGKTTTKEIIGKILLTDFDILMSQEAYNTDIGTLLTVFNEEVPSKLKSFFPWLGIVFRSYFKAFFIRHYPEKIIMEFGADEVGDIERLCNLFKPYRGVVLTVIPTHLESFHNVENIVREKEKLALGVRRKGFVFLNNDNEYTSEMKVRNGAKKIIFGTKGGEDFHASDLKSDLKGTSFSLIEKKEKHKIAARLYGEQMVYPLLAAIAVARSYNISYKKISRALIEIRPPKGRMNVLEGARNSIIIDDSYNSNPESCIKALDFLSRQEGRKIALLGSMNELGDYEKEGHERVGEKAAKASDVLVTVGESAKKYLAEGAKNGGLSSGKIRSFDSSIEAGKHVRKIIRPGDVLLVKGSQEKIRMERALEFLIKEKEKSEELLVRQGDFWKNKE